MKRVGIISGSYLLNVWNGLGRYTNSLAEGLAATHDVTVFAPSDRSKTYATQNGQTSIVHVAMSQVKKIASLPLEMLDEWNEAVSKTLESRQFDFIILPTCEGWLAAKKYKSENVDCKIIGCVPYLYRHAHWIPSLMTKSKMIAVEQDYLETCDYLTAHTMLQAETVANIAGKNVYVVPNPHASVEPPTSLGTVKKNHLVYVGRLNKTKAIETIFRAITKLPQINLTISSPEDSTTYAAKLTKLASNIDILNRVHMLGWTSTHGVRNLYNTADLAIVSGNSEPYGYGALDPQGLGTRVIVSGYSGLSDYMVREDNAYDNVDSLVALIQRKLSDSEEVATEERIDGIHAMSTKFSVASIAELFEDMLR